MCPVGSAQLIIRQFVNFVVVGESSGQSQESDVHSREQPAIRDAGRAGWPMGDLSGAQVTRPAREWANVPSFKTRSAE